ncbi:hypothetical protein C1646_679974 [Rhizophagus diaphanus]|nr:hypothetical protein C1646_679974 [Rhizophagus diaphanus] [Rhizophagus sp. MUCL 43196]
MTLAFAASCSASSASFVLSVLGIFFSVDGFFSMVDSSKIDSSSTLLSKISFNFDKFDIISPPFLFPSKISFKFDKISSISSFLSLSLPNTSFNFNKVCSSITLSSNDLIYSILSFLSFSFLFLSKISFSFDIIECSLIALSSNNLIYSISVSLIFL